MLLAALHFGIPFVVLLPRGPKRSPLLLGAIAIVVLAAHAVDVYWLVMPTLHRGGLRALDFAAGVLPASALFAVVARKAIGGPLFPTGDPRLGEAAELTNL